MKRKYLVVLVLSLLVTSSYVLMGSCAEQVEAPSQIIKDVNAQEAFGLIQENQGNPEFVVIDVRTPEEFTDGHIEGAINIDFNSQTFESEINKLPRNEKYLIYCRSGNRSRGALNVMVKLGFEEIYHLSVGIIGWLEEGFPTKK